MISLRTKLENHPLIDDVEQEMQRRKEEETVNDYENIIPKKKEKIDNETGDDDEE